MFPGGIANKLGNRFEAKWTVQKLLEVFLGQAESLRFESIDPVDHGVEFSLIRCSQTEWHQTKIQETKGNWTVRGLERKAVLTNALKKIAAGDNQWFVFVSETPAQGLHDLSEKANIGRTAREFESTLSDRERGELHSLNDVWKTKTVQAWVYLKRCRFEVVADRTLDAYIGLLAGLAFAEPVDTVFPLLRDYLESNFNRELRTEDLRKELIESKRLTPRAPFDPTLRECINQATQLYLGSYSPFGVGGERISRSQAKEVLDLLVEENGPNVVLLTGNAGVGKSGVVREVIEQLMERGLSHLAFRVDRYLTIQSTRDLGQALFNRPADPAVTLASLGGRDVSVLIIDQIDAVSEASGRIGPMRDVVFDLTRTAQASGCVRIVAVCRSFDLTNDATLRTMEQNEKVQRIEVTPLDWEQEIKPLLLAKNINTEQITLAQRVLLTLPLNLSLFLEVVTPDGRTIPFSSTSDLYNLLVERKQRAIRERGYTDLSVPRVMSVLAKAMSDDQLLDAPASVLDPFPNAVDLMASEHLIIKTGNRVAFFHESFFDYAFARNFVTEHRSLLEFLRSDEQFLFRRTQVRQILTAYRQLGNSARYLAELKDVLANTDVRYHLKDAVARWLGTVDDPSEGELDVVLSLDNPDERMPALVRLAVYRQINWFPTLRRRGHLTAWLRSGSEDRRRDALAVLRNAGASFPADVADILRAWWSEDLSRGKELLQWLTWLGEIGPTPELLALNLDVIRSNPSGLFDSGRQFDRLFLASWIKKDLAAAGEVFRVWLEKWFEVFPDDHPFKRDNWNDTDTYWLNELRIKSPTAFLDAAVPTFVETIRRINRSYDGQRRTDWTWYWRFEGENYGSDSFLAFLRAALGDVAKQEPERVRNYLQRIDPSSHPAALYLQLETIAANGMALGHMLLGLLSESEIFDAGPNGGRWLSFARAAKSALPHLSQEQKATIEDRILNHWDELNFAKKAAHELASGQPEDRAERRQEVIQYLNYNGYEQWGILKTIGQAFLSARAKKRLVIFERKFEGKIVEEPSNVKGGLVPPPIGAEHAKFMTDRQWVKAIQTYKDDRDTLRKGGRWVHHTGASGLARILQERTKDNPDRFVNLLLRLPADTTHKYPEGILFGLAESQASPETLLRAIRYAHSQLNRPLGNGICRILESHPKFADDDQAFEALVWYVEHGNAVTEGETEEKRIEQEIVSIDHLMRRGGALQIRGSYGDRGAAAEALGAVIWECPSRLEAAIDVLKRRVMDEHLLSIRCCLTRPIYSVLRHDNKRSSDLLRRLVVRSEGTELIPLTTYHGVHALLYILQGTPDIGRELLNLLLQSDNENDRLIGAFHLFREAFYDLDLAQRSDAIISVDDAHRKLAADAAANHLPHAEYRSRAEVQLGGFFDDQVKEIRAEAADCFRNLKAGDLDSYRPLLRRFIQSKAFETENFSFFFFLKEACDQTFEEVVLASERLMKLIEDDRRQGGSSLDLHYLDDLILREYAAVADRPQLRHRLLDVIDRMLFLELYGTDRIIQEHERD